LILFPPLSLPFRFISRLDAQLSEFVVVFSRRKKRAKDPKSSKCTHSNCVIIKKIQNHHQIVNFFSLALALRFWTEMAVPGTANEKKVKT
jgi:hypothetical protein